jgi:hypothetical protein
MTTLKKLLILVALTATSVLQASEWQLKLQSVIRSYDPQAVAAIESGAYVYRSHTQTFKVHAIDKTGKISEAAYEEEGPNVDGILLGITLEEGSYQGAADIPVELRKPYWTTFVNAYPVAGGKHLLLNLSYGSRADKKLIEAIKACMGPLQSSVSNTNSDKTIEFGGVQWLAWRTPFELQGDKLFSLPKARTGFSYGHGGNGRGATLITNVGNTDWRNYSVAFTFCMVAVNPSFNPHRLPMDYRGGNISFHIANAKESWNERGSSAYGFNINADGSWTLGCGYNSYSASSSGWFSPKNDGSRVLAQGKGLKLDFVNGNRYRIDVVFQRIQIWVDDEKIVDVIDEKMSEEIGSIRLDHGGISVNGGFECMIWLRDFLFRPL